jgi:polyisoprenoid-binding protein YceI
MFARAVLFAGSIAAVLAFTAGTAAADPVTYAVDSGHTFPTFEINHLGFSTQRGRFNETKGKITLDTKAKTAAAEILINARSINTGNDKLEEHLRKPDFFDVEKYPTISFKSTGAKFDDDKLVALDGNLTIKGETKPVTLTVSNFKCGENPMSKKAMCGGDVSTTIKRSDFGVKYGIPAVGDDVKISIPVEAYKE